VRRSATVSWDQVRAGSLLMVALTILALGIFFVGRTGHVFGERYRLVTLMQSAAGLVPGAAVQLAGQTVGQVDRIDLVRPEDRAGSAEPVAIWLAINREVQHQIRQDSRARARTMGLLGDKIIDIEPGSPDSPILQSGDTVISAQPLDYQLLLEEASTAIYALTDLTQNLADLTSGLLAGEGTAGRLVTDDALYRRLVELSASLDTVLSAVNSGEGTLGKLLRDDSLYVHLAGTASAFDSISTAIAEGRGSLGRLLASDSLYAALVSAAGRSDSLLAVVEAGEGTAGKLLADDALYEELLKTIVDLNVIISELREEPRKYIPPVEVF
jgi:phospholipid/cholesterol/gamma-HCH transport system substrate-binding protein